MAAADDRDGRAAGVERRRVRGTVDPDRQPGHDRRAGRDERRRRAAPRGPGPPVGRPAGPDDGDGVRRRRAPRIARGRTGRAAAGRWPPAAPGSRRRRRSRPAARARRIRSSVAAARPAALGDGRRPPRGVRTGRPDRSSGVALAGGRDEAPAAPPSRRATLAGSRARSRTGAAASRTPTGPRPSTPARTAQASRSPRHGPRGCARSRAGRHPPARPAVTAPTGPVAPTPSTSDRQAAAASAGLRPEPGGLVEMRRRARPRRRPGRRSSVRREAAAPSRARWLAPRSASATDPRAAAGSVEPACGPQGRARSAGR